MMQKILSISVIVISCDVNLESVEPWSKNKHYHIYAISWKIWSSVCCFETFWW